MTCFQEFPFITCFKILSYIVPQIILWTTCTRKLRCVTVLYHAKVEFLVGGWTSLTGFLLILMDSSTSLSHNSGRSSSLIFSYTSHCQFLWFCSSEEFKFVLPWWLWRLNALCSCHSSLFSPLKVVCSLLRASFCWLMLIYISYSFCWLILIYVYYSFC